MSHPRRLLTAAPPPAPLVAPPYSDMAIVMAGLLCGLICVLGLMSVTRCAWLYRRHHPTGVGSRDAVASDGGLKRKAVESLPKLTYKAAEAAEAVAECVICLAEFGDGDQIRVLPGCSHVFHVKCIDTWLGSHSSCPSCRQRLVVGRLRKCGGAAGDPPPPQVAGFLP